MKVIFLDIDGVLNNAGDFVEARTYGHPHNKGNEVLNRACLAILETLINATDAKIVVSSSWRREYSLDQLHEMFAVRGCTIARETFVDITNTLYRDNQHRGIEIRRYLDYHPAVENFVILDDNIESIHKEGFVPVSVNAYDTIGDYIETDSDSGLTPSQGLHASWKLGLNKAALDEQEKYQEALDLLSFCMV